MRARRVITPSARPILVVVGREPDVCATKPHTVSIKEPGSVWMTEAKMFGSRASAVQSVLRRYRAIRATDGKDWRVMKAGHRGHDWLSKDGLHPIRFEFTEPIKRKPWERAATGGIWS